MNSICRSREIKLISCSNLECYECKGNKLPQNCEMALSVERRYDVLMFHPDKKTIHLRCSAVDNENSEFESVFIGNFSLDGIWDNIVSAYFVDAYLSLFFKDTRTEMIHHLSFPRVKTSLEYKLIDEVGALFKKDFKGENRRINFQTRLISVEKWVNLHLSETLPEILPATRMMISSLVANANTPLDSFFPLILDECVEEIYLDRPDEFVYFDHSIFGRVKSSFVMKNHDVSKLCTLLRAESNLHLDRKTPSLKTDLIIHDVPLRVSTSLPPLSPDGMNLEIRRARVTPFNILDLIQNNTLDFFSAAILIAAINSRFNITITGEPGTGKTTLMNALDFTTPSHWRKIYIEDVLESRIVSGNHQIRFKVSPVDERNSSLDKATEIVKCLHRSPDYMVLGEIQTIEHSRALFQSLASGLCSIQTCHSSGPSSLITRWKIEHSINPSSIALMDLIVSLKRPNPGHSKRYVSEIAEIIRRKDSGLFEFAGINVIYSAENMNKLEGISTSNLSVDFVEKVEIIADKLREAINKDSQISTRVLQNLHMHLH